MMCGVGEVRKSWLGEEARCGGNVESGVRGLSAAACQRDDRPKVILGFLSSVLFLL